MIDMLSLGPSNCSRLLEQFEQDCYVLHYTAFCSCSGVVIQTTVLQMALFILSTCWNRWCWLSMLHLLNWLYMPRSLLASLRCWAPWCAHHLLLCWLGTRWHWEVRWAPPLAVVLGVSLAGSCRHSILLVCLFRPIIHGGIHWFISTGVALLVALLSSRHLSRTMVLHLLLTPWLFIMFRAWWCFGQHLFVVECKGRVLAWHGPFSTSVLPWSNI